MELTYPIQRRKSRAVKIGDVIIGGGFPIAIQSMTTTDTRNVDATVKQVTDLFEAGCDIVRLSVLNHQAADCLPAIRERITGPLVADIHFQYKLALKAIESGFDKIRINPGNIGAEWKVREVTKAAQEREIPIRIGVNSGSLPEDVLARHGHDDPRGFVEAALREVHILEDMNFENIVISVKSTNTHTAFWAYHMLARECDYPLHIGITESGILETGTIKSSVGIGAILMTGIGDTIRVSLAADPIHEPRVAKQILTSCGLGPDGVEVIACPTCGRCQIDMIPLAESISAKTRHIKKPLKVAVMGCAVNGPGEAKAADVGIAGGAGQGMIIKKGEVVARFKEAELESRLLDEIESMTGEKIPRG
ncbi:MAG: flavodoxin-dependent (E)-4-hydroxy-3-methylbut-2-enyl-diphosphate synthase [candidate division Zixibacteria bacterium]|jgi:(E)-4-hydroxy-3-methylbut-2-enyl-diphosphate synthase|nr:flavodoxin-dependent (E)-4-hydroxy-3-methylbut-2-enyl-diphosphate synthase [candidate division Zixibacteria bacterium]